MGKEYLMPCGSSDSCLTCVGNILKDSGENLCFHIDTLTPTALRQHFDTLNDIEIIEIRNKKIEEILNKE